MLKCRYAGHILASSSSNTGIPKRVRNDIYFTLSLRGIATQFRGNLIDINGLPRIINDARNGGEELYDAVSSTVWQS